MGERRFPILGFDSRGKQYRELGVPRSVPWSLVAPCEEQAEANHDQSLETLARRGGLDVVELAGVLTGRSWNKLRELTVETAASIVVEKASQHDQQKGLDHG